MKKLPNCDKAVAPVATSRLRTSDEAVSGLVPVFLWKALHLAPHFHQDLLDRAVDRGLDESALRSIAREWADKWNLSGLDGPCDWAVMIAVDTLKLTPTSGWNLGRFVSSEFNSTGMLLRSISPSETAEDDDREFTITVSQAEYHWKAWKEDPSALIERVLAATKDEIEDQVRLAAANYSSSRKGTRKWESDRALTWLIRYLFLDETFNAISEDSQKFLARPTERRGKPYGVAAVIRDVEEIAGQLGLELKKRGRGRPLGRKDSKTLRKVVGMPHRRNRPKFRRP